MAIISLKPLQAYLNPLKLSLLNMTTGNLQKGIQKTAQSIFSSASRGFLDAAKALQSQPFSTKSSLSSYSTSAYHLELSKNYTSNLKVDSFNNNGTINTGIIYNAQGRDTSKLTSTLDSLTTKTVSAKGQPAYTQATLINQAKNAYNVTDTNVNKTANSTDMGWITKNATGYVKQDYISSTSAQNTAKSTAQNATTATVTDTTLKDANNNVIKENYNNRIVDVNAKSISDQNIYTNGDRSVTQAVNTAKATIGGTTFTNTSVTTTDVRNTAQTVVNSADAQSATTTTNINKAGEVTGQQTVYKGSDYDQTQVTNTSESITSNRGVLTKKTGQNVSTTDQTITNDVLSQNSSALSSNTAQTLDAQGNVISSATTYVKSDTATQQRADTAVNQVIQQGPSGVQGSGTVAQEINTNITTNIQTSSPTAVTNRTVERDITKDVNRDWSGAIGVTTQADGAKAYNLASVDVSQANMVDVTKEGQNQLKITTQQNSAKEIQGNIDYKPAEVQPVSNVGASVGISFGTYTGLASSFKLDTGEVNFNLSFASADVTTQGTEKAVQGKATGNVDSTQGQLTGANLEGKLTSSVGADGSRIIEVTATYKKEGDKYVVENGVKKDTATGTDNSTVEVKGTITLNKDGNVKQMNSNFEVYKVEDAQAQGTSAQVVKKALDQTDPLSKSFSFENGTFKFQLGFASLNFAVYA